MNEVKVGDVFNVQDWDVSNLPRRIHDISPSGAIRYKLINAPNNDRNTFITSQAEIERYVKRGFWTYAGPGYPDGI